MEIRCFVLLLTGFQGRQPDNLTKTGEVFHLSKDACDILTSETALKMNYFHFLPLLRHNLSLKPVGISAAATAAPSRCTKTSSVCR